MHPFLYLSLSLRESFRIDASCGLPHWDYIQLTLYLEAALSLPSTAVILRLATTNSQRMSIRDVINVFSKNSYILRKKTRPLNLANMNVQAEVKDLFHTAKALQCLGLAAPQIGSQLRMFAMKDPFTGLVEMVINPVVVKKSRETLVDEEQCLSIPKYAFLVNRSKYITVNYTDNYGNRIYNRTFEGLDARVFQHEFDHLDGILASDRGSVVHVPYF